MNDWALDSIARSFQRLITDGYLGRIANALEKRNQLDSIEHKVDHVLTEVIHMSAEIDALKAELDTFKTTVNGIVTELDALAAKIDAGVNAGDLAAVAAATADLKTLRENLSAAGTRDDRSGSGGPPPPPTP